MKALVFLVLAVLALDPASAQVPRLLEQRLSDHLRLDPAFQFLTASRYVPIVAARGMGTWSSPRSSVMLEGVPFEGFPLNRVTPDFVPFDLVSTDHLEAISHPTLAAAASLPGGGVNIRRAPIADSLVVLARAFGGAETGDPVLEKYTRGNLDLYNKNKIGFSGAAMLSNRRGKFAYRFSGGIFGYFTAGYAGRDAVILAYNGRALLGRQNRNYVGSAEFEYETNDGTTVAAQAGANGIVGWEQMPFLPILGFFEGLTNTVRMSADRLAGGLSLHARRDGAFLSMRPQLGYGGGGFSSSVASIVPVWSGRLADHVLVTASGEIERNSVAGDFVSERYAAVSVAATVGVEVRLLDAIGLDATARYDRALERWNELSGDAAVRFQLRRDLGLTARLSSVAFFPSLLELHGSFATVRDRIALGRVDTFSVSGNPALIPGRISSASLRLDARMDEEAFFIEGAVVEQERIIDRSISQAIRTAWPGDYLFSGMYANASRRLSWSINTGGTIRLAPGAATSVLYQFTESRTVRTVPRHALTVVQEIAITPATDLTVTIHGAGKTFWKEFVVLPQNDEAGGGIDGVVPEYWSLDLSIGQMLGSVWFGRDITARLEIQNLFNRTVRRIPIGISFDTAVIGYLSLSL